MKDVISCLREINNGTLPRDSYIGKNRNTGDLGLTAQSELWNGRLAAIAFLAYLIWYINSYNITRGILYPIFYTHR